MSSRPLPNSIMDQLTGLTKCCNCQVVPVRPPLVIKVQCWFTLSVSRRLMINLKIKKKDYFRMYINKRNARRIYETADTANPLLAVSSMCSNQEGSNCPLCICSEFEVIKVNGFDGLISAMGNTMTEDTEEIWYKPDFASLLYENILLLLLLCCIFLFVFF